MSTGDRELTIVLAGIAVLVILVYAKSPAAAAVAGPFGEAAPGGGGAAGPAPISVHLRQPSFSGLAENYIPMFGFVGSTGYYG